MPTAKPRLILTLEPNLYRTISRLAELQGAPKARFVSELLETIHPPLMRTVALLEAARDAPSHVKRGLVRVLEGVETDLSAAAGDGLGQLDWLIGVVPGAVEGSAGVCPEGGVDSPPKGKNPRPSNTGVRVTFNSQKGGSKGRKKGGGK